MTTDVFVNSFTDRFEYRFEGSNRVTFEYGLIRRIATKITQLGKNTLRTQLDSILASHRGNRTMSTMGIGRLRGQFHTSAHQHAATIQPASRPGGNLPPGR